MRIGINVPWRDMSGELLDAAGIGVRAKMIEDADLDGIWIADHMVGSRPDNLTYLVAAGVATRSIELGTAIYILPLRNTWDLAQRFASLNTLLPGRFTLGVGTGSAKREFEMSGVSFEDRFKILREQMDTIRGVFRGDESPYQPKDGYGGDNVWWAEEAGSPRFVLGAWFSEAQLKRAAADYDGWMSSSGGGQRIGSWKIMGEAIKKYRDLGGERALIASVNVDLRVEGTPRTDDSPFVLQCSPAEATDRLRYLEELGYDDVILHYVDHRNKARGGMGFQWDFTSEDLEQIRSLIPKDPRRITSA